MRARSVGSLVLIAGVVGVGCTGSSLSNDSDTLGAPETGASTNAARGGTSTGGQGGTTTSGSPGTGGSVMPGAGGSVNNGGGPDNRGGMFAAGGVRSAGAPGGGAPGNGGVPAAGGARNNAGGAGMNTAGTMPSAMGGMAGAGRANMGGATGSGGAHPGGSGGMGGVAGGAGSGAGMAGDTSTEMCTPGTHAGKGTQHCGMSDSGTADGNYTYNIYSDGKGSGCMTTYGVDATFSATWSNVGDWIARVGLAFDKTKTYDKIGVFSSDFAYTTTGITTGGFGNIGIYGWSVNPLHEYYIIEDWLGKRPAFTSVGQFTIDGEGTYDIQTNTQNNQPNITGTNATFVQFWSVRTTPRACGHISISKHFDEWAKLGMQLGDLEEARILVEAQNNTGSIDFTTGTVVVQ